MSFDSPTALLLLPLVLPIVLVHFYRGRRRPVFVPSLLFWNQVLVEEERRSGLRRLRRYASLVLNLAALLVLVSMLAGPNVRGWTHEPERVVFVLDTSLGMAGGDRLGEARDRVRRSLRALYRSDEVSLYDSAGLLVPFTNDRERVLRALEGRPRWRLSGPGVAAAVRESCPEARVVEVSGSTAVPNAAITSARLEGASAVLRLEAFGIDGEASILIEGDGRAAGEIPVRIPGEARIALPEATLVRMARKPGDDQPLDDAAYFVLPPREPPSVVVLPEGGPDPFLLRALEILRDEGLIGSVGVVPVSEYPKVRHKLAQETLIISDGGDLGALGPGVFACFGSESDEWTAGPETGAVAVVDWDREHRMLESVDPSGLAIRESRVLSGGVCLLRSTEGPVALAGGGPGRAWAAFGFRIGASDLRLRPAFPLLLRNLVRWARSGAARAFPREVKSGGLLVNRYPLVPPEGVARIEWTDGRAVHREEIAYHGGTVRFPLVLPGFYRVSAGGRTEWVAVPNAPPGEADLSSAPPAPEVPVELPWYRDIPFVWAAGAVLALLLLVEWLLYQMGVI